ncbi:DUF4189 domain-containing protein, partial [Lactobacillus acidophilus]|uniref:DUF4189 domain-containing protein n=1 Tax=Lactobacillus acidophilus TaxID=1579 RepID=UPI0030F23A60
MTPPSERLADRWGAIVVDGVELKIGTAESKKSKAAAVRTATAMCREKGGNNCVLNLAYYSQCAVFVTGKKGYIS